MRYPTLAIKEYDSFPNGIDYRNQRSQLGGRFKVCLLEIRLRLDCLRDIARKYSRIKYSPFLETFHVAERQTVHRRPMDCSLGP